MKSTLIAISFQVNGLSWGFFLQARVKDSLPGSQGSLGWIQDFLSAGLSCLYLFFLSSLAPVSNFKPLVLHSARLEYFG